MESLRDDLKIFMLKILRYYFRIVPQGHNNCQFSIVNCQFGEAAQTPIFCSFINRSGYDTSIVNCQLSIVNSAKPLNNNLPVSERILFL